MFEIPGGWLICPWTRVRGLGLRVGEVAIGEGDGVLASGDRGMLCTDFLLCGDLMVCSLCFSPCKELGRENCDGAAGELGVLEVGELLLEELAVDRAESDAGDHMRVVGGDLGDLDLVGDPGKLSPEDSDLLSEPMLLLGVRGEPKCCSARRLLSRLNKEGRLFFSSLLPRWCRRLLDLRVILPALGWRLRPPTLIEVLSSGTAVIVTLSPPCRMRETTCTCNSPCTFSVLT